MRKWVIGALIGVVALSMSLDADAQRRLGGGKTFGKQSPTLQQRQATPPQQQTPPAQRATPAQQPAQAPAAGAATAAKPAASPLKGALLGLAAGLGLAALASWLGFGDTLATIMLVVLAGMLLMMVIGYFMRRSGAQPAYQGAGDGRYPPQPPEAMPRPIERSAIDQPVVRRGSAMDEFSRGAPNVDQPWGIPAGFDADGFLVNAKSYFTRLQTAWDKGDLDELSEFTTTEMFTALTHELRSRIGAGKSEVVTLEAKLLGIDSSATEHLASVRFTGTLRGEGELEQFDEVWNLTKPIDGKTGWLLAGIQQLA